MFMNNRMFRPGSGFYKLISIILAVLMLCSAAVLPSFAASPNDGRNTVLDYNKKLLDFINSSSVDPQSFYESGYNVSDSDKTLAAQITESYVTDTEKARAIHDWVCNNIYYDNDRINGVTAPNQEAANGRIKGLCGTYAEKFKTLCYAAGILCIYIDGPIAKFSSDQSRTINQFTAEIVGDHAWDILYTDGKWRLVDCTWDSQNTYSNGKYNYKACNSYYFDCNVDLFSESHLLEVDWKFKYDDYTLSLKCGRNQYSLSAVGYSGADRTLKVPSEFGSFALTDVSISSAGNSIKEIYVPQGVTSVNCIDFSAVEKMFIPAGVQTLSSLSDCAKLTDLYFGGTADQWKTLQSTGSSFNNTSAIIHYNCTEMADTGSNSGQSVKTSFWQKIANFFQKIINFFKGIFGAKLS
jgi:hypothetical protein